MSNKLPIWIGGVILAICFTSCRSTKLEQTNWDVIIGNNVKAYAKARPIPQTQIVPADYEMDASERLNNQITSIFTIYKIFHGDGVDEILLSTNDSIIYEVYSPWGTGENKGLRIQQGHKYQMTITPYFKEKYHARTMEMVRPVTIKGYLIIPYPIYRGQVYYVDNLHGIYLDSTYTRY